MLRIRAITPIHVDGDELERRQHRYDRLAPEGVFVHLDDLGDALSVPRSLETETDVRRSEALVVAQIHRTETDRFDAVLPDCVLDPGVGVTPGARLPVLGLLRLCTHALAGTGQLFAAVTRNQAIAAELTRKVSSYGLGGSLVEVRVLGLGVADIADDQTWAAAIARSVAHLSVAAVVNGCSAVEVASAPTGARIVDPTATALRQIALAHALGLVAGADDRATGR